MDKTIENIDSTNDELESLIGANDSSEEKLAKLEEANKKLYARTKAAEEELKGLKKKENPQPISNNAPVNSLTREEAMLIAKGVDDKSLELLNKISKLDGTSLLEAMNSEVYKLHQAKIEQEKKSESAKLGASKGSGRIESVKTSGMSREEHQAYVKEQMGL